MLATFVGAVDFNAALVLAVAFVCACVVTTTLIARRRSRQDIANEYALKKMNQEAARERSMYDAETERGYKFKQLEQNLITSHVREK